LDTRTIFYNLSQSAVYDTTRFDQITIIEQIRKFVILLNSKEASVFSDIVIDIVSTYCLNYANQTVVFFVANM